MSKTIEVSVLGIMMFFAAYLLSTASANAYLVHWYGALVEVLNFQPFGDHGVNNIWSIRMVHILGAYAIYWVLNKQISKRL